MDFSREEDELNMKSKEDFFNMYKTPKARDLAKSIDLYLYNESQYKHEVEDYHERYNDGKRTDCIGYISKNGFYKFASLTAARKGCFVLHLGKKLHTQKAMFMQKIIDDTLTRKYEESDRIKLTPGEIYIRLEWVKNLEQIIPFIDEAYHLRLKK